MRCHDVESGDVVTFQLGSIYSIKERQALTPGLQCLATEEQSVVQISSSKVGDLLEALSMLLMLSALCRCCLWSCL